MKLKQILLRQMLLWSVVSILIVMVLVVLRAQFDVRRESAGVQESGQLVQSMIALQTAPSETLPKILAQMQALNGAEALRHVQVEVRDPENNIRVTTQTKSLSTWRLFLTRTLWGKNFSQSYSQVQTISVPRTEGVWQVRWLLNPHSEEQEALDNILGVALSLLVFGSTLVLGALWGIHRALYPLRSIVTAVQAYIDQRYETRVPAIPVTEFQQIGNALNHLSEQLRSAETARKILSLKVLTLQEAERNQLAREMHDEMGQWLTALSADVAWLKRQLTATSMNVKGENSVTQEVINGMSQSVQTLQQSVRRLLQDLRPTHFSQWEEAQQIEIEALLMTLTQQWKQRTPEVPDIKLMVQPVNLTVPQNFALALYRMSQEALTNAIKHAQAKHITLSLVLDQEKAGALIWQVEDDGRGLNRVVDSSLSKKHQDEPWEQGGNGWLGIRERVWAYDGTLTWQDAVPHGLILQASFPTTVLSDKEPLS